MDDPEISVSLPRSIWQGIQTMLAVERDLHPDSSEEARRLTAIIELIQRRTGIEPQWDLIP